LGPPLIIANILHPTQPFIDTTNLVNPGLAGGLTLLISAALLAAWLFYFTSTAVWRVGCVYAERLLEQLPGLRASAKKS